MKRTVQLKRLVDPMRPITYGIVQAGENVPDGVPYIRPVDMVAWARDLDPNALQRTSIEIASQYQRSTVRGGDLVVSIGPSFGKLLLVPDYLTGANLTQGTARVAPAAGVDPRYLQWALRTSAVRDYWAREAGGATFRALNLGPLTRTPVVMHDHDEQRRIAGRLDK